MESNAQSERPVFEDISRSPNERAADLVSRMTREEKVSQMTHRAPAIPRLGIPEYNWWNECLHGVERAGKATVFPQSVGLAATFDPPLVRRVATAISDEARAKHHQALRQGNRGQYFGLTYWTPNINIFRDPRWGRGQETYGEDPYLTARLGVAFVNGLQGNDPRCLKLVATPKHFAVHSGPEPQRHHFDAVASPRDMRETYLPAFEACVREAGAASVMGAYNRTNGEPCCASKTLLIDILRDEWGFRGYVVSDCGAICDIHDHHRVTDSAAESAALAVRNGCDLNCGGVYSALLTALDDGLIDEEDIDTALKRLFAARFQLGMFDPPDTIPYSNIPPTIVNGQKHRELARQVARDSLVLLKNDNAVLPLRKDLKNIAVVGPVAYDTRVLHGNYYGYAGQMTTILEGIVDAVAAGTQVNYEPGCGLASADPVAEGAVKRAADQADVVVAALGYSPELEGEEGAVNTVAMSEGGGDRLSIDLPGRQEELLKLLCSSGKPVVLVLTGGSPIALNWAKENVPAILMSWYPGEQGGNAVADVLFGDVSPSGRLPLTFVKSLDDLPPFENYSMQQRTYRFMDAEPLFPFGYGLSYTAFRYTNLKFSRETVKAGQDVVVTADVRNTGRRASDEIVQLYIADREASVPVPALHLEGVRRIRLEPHETQTVAFTIHARQFAAYRDDGTAFIEPGEFVISIGGGQPADPAAAAVSATLTIEE